MKNLNVTLKIYFLILVCVGGLFSSFIKTEKNTENEEKCNTKYKMKCENAVSSNTQKNLFLLASVER